LSNSISQAQTENQPADTSKYTRTLDSEDYNAELLNDLLKIEINKYRLKQKSDTLTFESLLKSAADDQATFMAQTNNATYDQGGKKSTTGKRIAFYGGSNNGNELVVKMPIKKGNELFTYGKVVEDIMFKWLSDKKGIVVLNDPAYMFFGIGSALDADHKKVMFL